MLVIMEDGDIALFNQNTLNLKALGRLDVFQINATEGIRDSGYCIDKA